MHDVVDHEGRMRMGGRPRGLGAATLIDGDIDDDRKVKYIGWARPMSALDFGRRLRRVRVMSALLTRPSRA
jgi:hypothetical protein